jgi:hypothetical protein
MKNAIGSKSARTQKAPKGNPASEVVLDNGTVAVLPNPADAPAPPKAPRNRKPEPTVATKAEVPGWAKRAAARDTAAEMAPVPEAAPMAKPAPATTPPASRRARAPKAAKVPAPAKGKATPPAPAGSLRAIGNGWLDHMKAKGSAPSTLSSYAADLDVAHEFFGDAKATEVTADQIAKFEVSKGVVKKASGKPKAKPTILKTRRALRLALTWAVEKKLLKAAPYPAA